MPHPGAPSSPPQGFWEVSEPHVQALCKRCVYTVTCVTRGHGRGGWGRAGREGEAVTGLRGTASTGGGGRWDSPGRSAGGRHSPPSGREELVSASPQPSPSSLCGPAPSGTALPAACLLRGLAHRRRQTPSPTSKAAFTSMAPALSFLAHDLHLLICHRSFHSAPRAPSEALSHLRGGAGGAGGGPGTRALHRPPPPRKRLPGSRPRLPGLPMGRPGERCPLPKRLPNHQTQSPRHLLEPLQPRAAFPREGR